MPFLGARSKAMLQLCDAKKISRIEKTFSKGKILMSSQIARLNAEIANLEAEKERLQSQANNASSQYNIGVFGVIIGLLLLFFTSVYWLGGLLFLAGALTVFTQGSKKRAAFRQIDNLRAQIKKKRNKIIDLAE